MPLEVIQQQAIDHIKLLIVQCEEDETAERFCNLVNQYLEGLFTVSMDTESKVSLYRKLSLIFHPDKITHHLSANELNFLQKFELTRHMQHHLEEIKATNFSVAAQRANFQAKYIAANILFVTFIQIKLQNNEEAVEEFRKILKTFYPGLKPMFVLFSHLGLYPQPLRFTAKTVGYTAISALSIVAILSDMPILFLNLSLMTLAWAINNVTGGAYYSILERNKQRDRNNLELGLKFLLTKYLHLELEDELLKGISANIKNDPTRLSAFVEAIVGTYRSPWWTDSAPQNTALASTRQASIIVTANPLVKAKIIFTKLVVQPILLLTLGTILLSFSAIQAAFNLMSYIKLGLLYTATCAVLLAVNMPLYLYKGLIEFPCKGIRGCQNLVRRQGLFTSSTPIPTSTSQNLFDGLSPAH